MARESHAGQRPAPRIECDAADTLRTRRLESLRFPPDDGVRVAAIAADVDLVQQDLPFKSVAKMLEQRAFRPSFKAPDRGDDQP